ncbi:MAG: (2Fe-2S)-binding protein [Zunongwangia sp.]|uniref:(2Fe-2S)-binding protein n=1 Tax=Zunongwangia sp. TaxID=1965325 RepID=UPI0032426C9F
MKKSMKASLVLNVNGKDRSLRVAPETPLLYALRNNLELNGPKFGCGLEQCGACMVLLNGKANPSCRIPVSEVIEKKIVTIEGLAENGNLHPLQQAFIDEQAAQCGYCLNGVLINSVSLLNENKNPTAAEIKNGLEKNICRCGTHSRFIKAIKKVSKS